MTDQSEEKRRAPLRPLQSIPPIADTAVNPIGEIAVEVEDLCDRAGIRYRVTGGVPPKVILREGGGHARGQLAGCRGCFVVDTSGMPADDPERSMRVLEILVRCFGCYEAHVSLCDRGYFSPDISTTYSGKVIIGHHIADMLARLARVLGSRKLALVWLKTPRRQLEGQAPLETVLHGDLASIETLIDALETGQPI